MGYGSDYQSGHRYYAGFGEWRTGGSGNKTLSINDGAYVNTHSSDWEVREVLVEQHLTPSEYANLRTCYTNKQ